MPKNSYRLQQVLNVRDRAKQDAARHLALRRAQLAEAEAELAQREQAVSNCQSRQVAAHEKMMQEASGGIEAGQALAHRTHLADLRRLEQELKVRVEQQKTVVERAQAEVEKALTTLIEASKELQIIEKHREEWSQRTRLETERRAQKSGDEIGALMYERQRKPDR
jgi:flagellar export protein FliJ